MRKLSLILYVSGLLSLVVFSQAAANDWEHYSFNADNDALLYDKGNIVIKDYIATVYQKELYDLNTLFWLVQRKGKKFDDLRSAVNLLTINCTTSHFKLTSTTFYDSEGKILEIRDYGERNEWKEVSDSQDIRILHDLCCFNDWKSIAASETHDYFLNIGTIQVNNSNANVTFWMKEVDKKTAKETEREKITMVCEKDKYTLRHLMKYNPDGSVKEVLTDSHLRKWIPITPKSIIDGFHTLLCDEKYVRQNVKEYVQSVSK
jgi:hypothetical protein